MINYKMHTNNMQSKQSEFFDSIISKIIEKKAVYSMHFPYSKK